MKAHLTEAARLMAEAQVELDEAARKHEISRDEHTALITAASHARADIFRIGDRKPKKKESLQSE
jgi:predicted DNA-binding protein (UPF0251 family)